MKKLFLITLISFFSITTSKIVKAQTDTIYEHKYSNLYYSVGLLKDSLRVGTWITYTTNTNKKTMISEYNMTGIYPQKVKVTVYGGQAMGIHKYTLYLETDTSEGYNVGYDYYFSQDSVLYSKSFYNSDGLLDGKSYFYYKNGQVEEITEYKNGKLNGKIKKYHQNGNKLLTGGYKNSLKIGKWKIYYEDGTLKSKGRYTGTTQIDTIPIDTALNKVQSGVYIVYSHQTSYHKNGKWKYYNKDGKLTKIEYYKNSGTPYREEEY